MSYHKTGQKFHRKRNQRNALLRSLALSLIQKEKIKTTESKARALRPIVEKMITKGKVASVARKRLLMKRLKNKSGVSKLFVTLGPRYKERAGGYTRITKLGERRSDGSKMAIIELM